MAGGAGAVGAVGAGVVVGVLLEETVVDKNYHEVLNFIIRELWKKMNEKREVNHIIQVFN